MNTIFLIFMGAQLVITVVSLINLISMPWIEWAGKQGEKEVSNRKILPDILVPVRNEEARIEPLLNSLEGSLPSLRKVIFCDDHSTDSTASIIEGSIKKCQQISMIKGAELPDGWNGKTFACHQLAQKSESNLMLFLDADVTLAPQLPVVISNILTKKQLALVSVFPLQEMKSVGELTTVPIMHWILLSLLPLRMVYWLKGKSIAAANGQVMLFDSKIYRLNQWHRLVKDEVVEDIKIARLIKSRNYKMAVYVSHNLVRCRMYGSYKEAIKGFSKNIHEFFGGSRLIALLYFILLGVGPLAVLPFLTFWQSILLACFIIINRLSTSFAAGQNGLINLLLHPLQVLAMGHILIVNFIEKTKKRIQWKDRNIDLD